MTGQPTPPAPSILAADLLARGVAFNPRFVRPTRLPRWPGIAGRAAEGVIVDFGDGVTVIPPVAGKDDPAAFRLRDVRGEVLLKDGGEARGAVALTRMPPGFGEASPSRIPYPSFLAPLPGVLAVDLCGGGDVSFSGPDRCSFCAADPGPAPRVVDLAEGFARFGAGRALHLCLCCRHRNDEAALGAAVETATAVLGAAALSVEVPPGGGREGLRALAARGVAQMIVDLDAPDAATFLARCPGRGAAIGWEALAAQVDDGLAVLGKGRVGVRMVLFPGDAERAFAALRGPAAAGAVPVIVPFAPAGGPAHDPAELRHLAARLAARCRIAALPIDPYAGTRLPLAAAAPLPWWRRLLDRLGILRGALP